MNKMNIFLLNCIAAVTAVAMVGCSTFNAEDVSESTRTLSQQQDAQPRQSLVQLIEVLFEGKEELTERLGNTSLPKEDNSGIEPSIDLQNADSKSTIATVKAGEELNKKSENLNKDDSTVSPTLNSEKVTQSTEKLESPPKIDKVYSLSDLEKDLLDPFSGQLFRDFELAKLNDPQYQSAILDYRTEIIQADLARFSFLPTVNLSNQFLPNETGSRTVLSVSQPIFNLDRLATLQEEDSRRAMAEAKLRIMEYQLVERLINTISLVILAQESLTVNGARVEALENEFKGAKREFELGRGTVTDIADTEVRMEQAKAQQFKLKAQRDSAIRTLEQITGRRPNPELYKLRKSPRRISLRSLDVYLEEGGQFNSRLIQARAAERLAELSALKAKGQYIPSVSYTASRSYSERGDLSNAGITFGFDVPVNAGTIANAEFVASRISQSKLTTRSTRQETELSIRSTYGELVSGIDEVNVRLKAISAAELSLNATEKSYKGGVRTRLDVLNSLQTLYVVNEQYLNSVVELSRNYMNLNNQTSRPIGETVAALQELLF